MAIWHFVPNSRRFVRNARHITIRRIFATKRQYVKLNLFTFCQDFRTFYWSFTKRADNSTFCRMSDFHVSTKRRDFTTFT